MEDKIKVKYNGRYLLAYMPNGDVIPQQTEIKIENNVGDKNMALVTIQAYADISDLKEMGRPEINWKKSSDYFQSKSMELVVRVETLEHELKRFKDNAKTWRDLYNAELKRNWIEKLFGM